MKRIKIFALLSFVSVDGQSCSDAIDVETRENFPGFYSAQQTSSSGVILDYGKCIYVIKDQPRKWIFANDWCKQNVPKRSTCTDGWACTGKLTSIHSDLQMNAILENSNPGEYWIGLRQHCSTCALEWNDFSPLDYTAWYAGEPNNWGEGEDCVQTSYWGPDWENPNREFWNDDHCDKEFMFICEAYDQALHKAVDTWPTMGGCKEGWSKFGGGCFLIYGNKNADATYVRKPFQEANQFCAQTWSGASLAVFPNPYYQFFANSMLQSESQNNRALWIGALTTAQDHLFHWIDGSKMTFTDWRAGEPNGDMTGEDAVEMYYTVGSSGTWNDLPPSYEKGFMCSHQLSPSETGSGPDPFKCPDGFVPFRSFCYRLDANKKATFDMARADCQSFTNGDLVSVIDDYEFNFVRSLIYRTIDTPTSGGNEFNPSAWIGLSVYNSNSGNVIYKWADEFPFTVTYWDFNQPDKNSIPNEPGRACISMQTPYGNWAINPTCDLSLNYVCKLNMDNLSFDNIPDERGEPLDCEEGWLTMADSNHHCFKPYPGVVDWFTAEGKCVNKNFGHLVSLHSVTKNTQARALFDTVSGGETFWVGAKRNEVLGFEWTDGSDFSYTNWRVNEPSGEWNGVAEDCLTVDSAGTWNDDSCTIDQHGYLCQKARPLQNCAIVPDVDKIACSFTGTRATGQLRMSERQCMIEKCCWDPQSRITCFKPDGASAGSGGGSMTAGKAAGIVAGVFIAINMAAVAYFVMFRSK